MTGWLVERECCGQGTQRGAREEGLGPGSFCPSLCWKWDVSVASRDASPRRGTPSVLRLGREGGMCPRKRGDLSILSSVVGLYWVVFIDFWLVILNTIDFRDASNGCPVSMLLICIFTICWLQLIDYTI